MRFRARARRLALIVVTTAVGVGAGALAAAADPGAEGRAESEAQPAASAADKAKRGKGLRPFASCKRLREYVRRANRRGAWPGVAELHSGGDDAGATGATDSPTNVQEPGVDEPDIVKTAGDDGELILVLAHDALHAVDASRPVPIRVGSIELPRATGKRAYVERRELLASGERALVIAEEDGPAGPFGSWVPTTVITEVDVSKPGALRILRTQVIEGGYVSARLVGETARIVLSSAPDRATPIPRAELRDRVAGERTEAKLLPCGSVMRPSRFSGLALATVLTVDFNQGLPAVDADAVVSGGEIVYASATGLYVATERWRSFRRRNDGPPTKTQIHRFDTTAPDATEYAASGVVRGSMMSQWAMSEHEGNLRVASTTRRPGRGPWGRSRSQVTVLTAQGQRLKRVGRVGGLGKGEDIYAVRFLGDVGVVVTFREIDPLYTLDLSNPTRPRTLGELKIRGFSTYLHPTANGRLLGIGQLATLRGRLLGARAALFDVANLRRPRKIVAKQLAERWSYSPVEYNHRAFMFHPPTRLAVVPIQEYSRGQEFAGAIGLRVRANGLKRIRRLEHPGHDGSAIQRSLVTQGRLYTISGEAVVAHGLKKLRRLGGTRLDRARGGEFGYRR